jgi:hypothetical protein
MAQCSNCEKTKKKCSFDWLRSQRVLQSKEQPANLVPPTKRRRISSTELTIQSGVDHRSHTMGPLHQYSVNSNTLLSQRAAQSGLGITFADFPGMFDTDPAIPLFGTGHYMSSDQGLSESLRDLNQMIEADDIVPDDDSGKGSSLAASFEQFDDESRIDHPNPSHTPLVEGNSTRTTDSVTHSSQKRRRSCSSRSTRNDASSRPEASHTSDIVLSINNKVLTEDLLKIYHNSFENALSCWTTERTCLSSTRSSLSMINETCPNWNHIYHRVFRLDRISTNLRGRQLTFAEDQAACKALNLAIYSFATQWGQSSQVGARYPFDGAGITDASADADGAVQPEGEVDRVLQTNAWHEARNALQTASDIDSFRVVLGQMVFSLTQKPLETIRAGEDTDPGHGEMHGQDGSQLEVDQELDVCEDLLSKLNIAIDDRPQTHLAQGLRLIHSLRSRMMMWNNNQRQQAGGLRYGKQYRSSTGQLDDMDRAAVDLLFWLGVMLDTLSAAIGKRPLVVSDEDSDIYPNEPERMGTNSEEGVLKAKSANGLWDTHLFARQDSRLQKDPIRWPCSFDQAVALLCDAAPVKVLLFRKVTRIQTLLARGIHGTKIEAALSTALSVHEHWTRLYAPFLRDCIQYHDQLPPRIQSWYICLAAHWHLATLLLADWIEVVDDSKLGLTKPSKQRSYDDLVASFRVENCQTVSDIANAICPRSNASFVQSRNFHFTFDHRPRRNEPWIVIVIRVFAKASVILLESDALLSLSDKTCKRDYIFKQAEDCVRALWYLGKTSDVALSAAKILEAAFRRIPSRERCQDVQESMSDSGPFLDTNLWPKFQHCEGTFAVGYEL